MKLRKYLTNEAYSKNFFTGEPFEVFEIPPMSMKDLRKLTYIRFTAINKGKKLYLWSALNANHNDVWFDLIGKGKKYPSDPNTKSLQGQAKKVSGKWVMHIWDDGDFYEDWGKKISREKMAKSYKWVDTYINVTDHILDEG
jgi:hypothetical protein